MKFDRHLFLLEVTLPPSIEWTDASESWRLVRLSKGAAYWLGEGTARELQEGEIVVVAPSNKGCLRASQIGEVKLHCFHFCPELLSGFLTLSERHYFETTAAKAEPSARFLAATHPAALEFAALVDQQAVANNLAYRCQLMHLVASIFTEEMGRHHPPVPKSAAAQVRFDQLINEMPEGDLIKYTPEQLAKLCGCSVRHFSRIFRQHFGIAVRVKQTELRLLKARQLLTDTDAKIIHVALESGYRHLGLFNSMFKKYLGMTPSEWRHKTVKKPRKIARVAGLILAVSLFVSSFAAPAAPLPPTGATNNAAQPTNAPAVDPGAPRFLIQPTNQTVNPGDAATFGVTATATTAEPLSYQWRFNGRPLSGQTNSSLTVSNVNGGHSGKYDVYVSNQSGAVTSAVAVLYVTFPVEGYAITGNTLFKYADLEPIFKKYVGPGVSVENLFQAQGELQMAYRNRGFVTVSVTLPPQEITNRLVQLKVTEGRLAEINVINNRYFSSNNIMRALPSLQTNILLNSLAFQQDLDRANASRDRQIYPQVAPGPDPGTSTLNLRVKDRFPLHARMELNNYATPGTPELRLNSAAQYNNLWQLEHQVGLQYSFSPEKTKGESQLPAFYDQPLVANYSAFYRMPLDYGKAKDRGRSPQVGDFGYDEATKRFRAPPAGNFPDLIFYASRSFSDTGLNLESETVTQPADFDTHGGLQIRDQTFSQTLTKNEGLGFRLSDPLPAVAGIRSSFSAGLDYKSFREQSLLREQFSASLTLPSVGTIGPPFNRPIPAASPDPTERRTFTSVHYLPFALAWEASKSDKWGFTAFNLNTSFNSSSLFNNKADFRRVALSRQADGNYVILAPGLTREQNLAGDWAVRLHADGQWANQPLISNEQFGIGGLAGVRGYRDGQEYGDTGWRTTIEPHTPLFKVGMVDETLPMQIRFSVFNDYGRRYLIDPTPGRKGDLGLWGAGFGFNGVIGERMDFRFSLAFPLLDTPGVPAGKMRISFAVSAQF